MNDTCLTAGLAVEPPLVNISGFVGAAGGGFVGAAPEDELYGDLMDSSGRGGSTLLQTQLAEVRC